MKIDISVTEVYRIMRLGILLDWAIQERPEWVEVPESELRESVTQEDVDLLLEEYNKVHDEKL